MIAVLTRLLAPVGQWLAVAGAVVAAFLWARQTGKNAARAEANEQTLKDVETRNAVERDVAREPDASKRLFNEWKR